MIRFYKRCILFSFLIFLQSCSGSKIGNFLELSFEDIEQEEQLDRYLLDLDDTSSINEIDRINQDSLGSDDIDIGTDEMIDIEDELDIVIDNELIKSDEIIDIKDELNIVIDNELIKSDEDINEDKNNNQTYRIVVILKDLDPTAPSEALTNVLREFNFNFEIEKIERYSQENEQN